MKVEELIIPLPDSSTVASPLGSHAFLDEFALAYHRSVAVRLRAEPETVVASARQNLNRWAEGDTFGPGEKTSLEEWRNILGGGDVEQLIEIITDTSDEGQRLRSSSPFVGTLTPGERLEILAACEQRATA